MILPTFVISLYNKNEQTNANLNKFLYVLPSEHFISILHLFFAKSEVITIALNFQVKPLKQGVLTALHKLTHLISA